MTCPSVRPNSEDTWPKPPATEDELKQPNFPRIRMPDLRGPRTPRRPIPDELVPPRPPTDPPPRPNGEPGEPPDPNEPPQWPPEWPDEDGYRRPTYDDPPGQGPDFPDETPDETVIDRQYDPDSSSLKSPDGIDLEQWEIGFEDNDSFFHEDYDLPDERPKDLTLLPQTQEIEQNARLLNLWFKNLGTGLIRGQLPNLNVNIGALLQPQLRNMLEANLKTEYARAENYYASLFAKVFSQQKNGGTSSTPELSPHPGYQTVPGSLTEADLQVAAGVAITGIGIAASYGFLYRGGRGGFIAPGHMRDILKAP